MRGLSFKQSRRAEYDRPTALPCWVRMRVAISGADDAIAFLSNETRSSGRIPAPRVNSGTAKKKDAKAVSCSVDGREDATLNESAGRRACGV